MSRWVTFYQDLLQNRVVGLKVHDDKADALRYFNLHCKDYFSLNSDFKAKTLPASYGYPHRKYFGVSVAKFREIFGITVDEALKIQKGEKEAQ